MAVEVEASGQVDEFLRVLRRRIWWIIIPFVVIGSLGTFIAVVVPKKYVVFSEVMVKDLNPAAGPEGQNASEMEGQVASYRIRAPQRIHTVLNAANWDEYNSLNHPQRQEFITDLLRDLKVKLPTMPRDSHKQLVEISFKHTDPVKAHDFLTKLQKSWKDEILQGALRRTQKTLRETGIRLAELESLAKDNADDQEVIRNDYEIPSPGPSSLQGREPNLVPEVFMRQQSVDSEIATLEIEEELAADEVDELVSEYDQLPSQVLIEGETNSDPVDKQIKGIDLEIGALNDEIERRGWSSSNPERQRAEAKISRLMRDKQQAQQKRSRAVIDPSAYGPNPAREAKKLVVDKAQRSLKRMRSKLASLRASKANLKDEAELLREAMSKLDLLGQIAQEISVERTGLVRRRGTLTIQEALLDSPEGNPFEVQRAPAIPTKASSPNAVAISVGSILMGLALGLALAVLKEYSKSCFRSPRELSRVMTHPVLGTINQIRTRRERARALLVRGVMGGGSALFALSVGYVTWAWAKNPDGLTDSLRDAIENFRSLLM